MIDIASAEEYLRTANPIPTLDALDADELATAVAATRTRRATAMQAPSPHTTPATPPPAPPRRHGLWAFAAAFILILAAVGAAAFFFRGDDSQVTDEPPPPTTGGAAIVTVSAGTFELPIGEGACTQRDALISVVARSDEASLVLVGPADGAMVVGFELSSGELWSRLAAPVVVDGTTMSFNGSVAGPAAETISVQVSCGEIVTVEGEGAPVRSLDEPVVGGDLLLMMHPGSGPGKAADLLARRADGVGAGVEEGTAKYVAWFDGQYRPMQVVTFTATRDNPRRGGPEYCVFWGDGGGCVLDPNEPRAWRTGIGAAEAYGGTDGAEAVFTTESGNTVSVLTVDGYARAEWPNKWGWPQTIEFYDVAGNLLVSLDTSFAATG